MPRDALKTAGCDKLFADKAPWTTKDRPQLIKCLEQLREGNTLVVWKLDRLGRSTLHISEESSKR